MPLGPMGTDSVSSQFGVSSKSRVHMFLHSKEHRAGCSCSAVSALQAPAPGIGRMNRDLVW